MNSLHLDIVPIDDTNTYRLTVQVGNNTPEEYRPLTLDDLTDIVQKVLLVTK